MELQKKGSTSGAEMASVLGFLGYHQESMAEFAKLTSGDECLENQFPTP